MQSCNPAILHPASELYLALTVLGGKAEGVGSGDQFVAACASMRTSLVIDTHGEVSIKAINGHC